MSPKNLDKSLINETVGNIVKPQKETMSMKAIAVRIPDKSVKLGDADGRRVLTTLGVIYEGGSLDGKNANFPTRDLSSVVVGLHQGNWHLFETYQRTIWFNIRNRRTIFRCIGRTVKSNRDSNSWWKRLLTVLRIRKPKAIVI
jgi:hypothetical protein